MDFAQIFGNLTKKYKKKFRLLDLAREAKISKSYVTKLKTQTDTESETKPKPSENTARDIAIALDKFGVEHADIAQLVESAGYSWSKVQNSLPTISILKAIENTSPQAFKEKFDQKEPCASNFFANHAPVLINIFFAEVIELLHNAIKLQNEGENIGDVYILTSLNPGQDYKEFLDSTSNCFQQLKTKNENLKLFHLLSSNQNDLFTLLNTIFSACLRTSGYHLYSIEPENNLLPEIVIIEGLEVLLALPVQEDQESNLLKYSIIRSENEDIRNSYTDNIKYLRDRKKGKQLLIKTYFNYKGIYSDEKVIERLRKAEEDPINEKAERLVLKQVFSSVFRSKDKLRKRLEVEQLAKNIKQDQIESYLAAHEKRASALIKNLSNRNEKHIYNQNALKKDFKEMAQALCKNAPVTDIDKAIAELLYDQTIRVIGTLNNESLKLHIGLEDSEILQHYPTITLLENTAFLVTSENPKHIGDRSTAAKSQHTEFVGKMRKEFYERWGKISLKTTAEDKNNVIGWLLTSVLEALIQAKMPVNDFFSLAKDIISAIPNQTIEKFYESLLNYEQKSKTILTVAKYFPRFTLPPDETKDFKIDPVILRRLLLPRIVQDTENRQFKIVMTEADINNYWKTGEYNRGENRKDKIEEDYKNICSFLKKHKKNVSLYIIENKTFNLPVSFQVIDQKVTFFKMSNTINEKLGIILQNSELSKALQTYFEELITKTEDIKVIKPRDAIDWLKHSFNCAKSID